MQRDASTADMIDRANKLSVTIDNSPVRPTRQLKEFRKLCKYLQERGVDLEESVRPITNW